MSEVIKNKYLDFSGLSKYDELIKNFIASGNKELADAITALNEKIGSLDIEGSDDKSLSEVVYEIYTTIESLESKDAEIENEIKGIIGDLESLEDSDAVMTLVEISNKLKALESSVSKNTEDITNITERVTTVEEAVKKLGEIEGGESLGEIVTEVKGNTSAIATLKGDGEGSVKKIAQDAADAAKDAAIADAAEKYQVKGEYEVAGAAATAEQNAKDYADEKAGANAEAIGGLTDRIGTLEGISHASDVKYEGGYINLYDENGNKIGDGFDASPFVVDGMLDSVSFEEVEGVKTNNLVFTFNTSSGKENITVDFSKYVDTYHADGSSIELNSESKTFSVKEVDASKTKLSTSIEVNGGPLADDSNDNWPWTENGVKVIPAGKSMEEILTSLFLKVTNGTVSKGSITWDPKLSAPTVSITKSGTVEVGTKLTANANTTNTVTGNSRTCIFTCKPGHFLSTGTDESGKLIFGSYVSGNKTVTANSVDPATSGTPTIKTYWNGSEVTNENGVTEYTVSIVGTNTFKVDQSGVTAYAGAFDDITVYGATNTKVPVETVKASITNDVAPAQKSLTSTNKAEVTGARAYWMGAMSQPLTEFTSASIRTAGETSGSGLTKTLGSNPATKLIVPAGQYDVVIATQKEIDKVTSEAQFGSAITGNFTANHTEVNIEGANGFTSVKYHVYHCNTNWDADTLTITYK